MENSNQNSRLDRIEAMQEVITKNFVQMQENHLQSQERNAAMFDELHRVLIRMMKTEEMTVSGVREIESTIKKTAKVLSEHQPVLSK